MELDILVGNNPNLTKLDFLWVEYEMGLLFLCICCISWGVFFSVKVKIPPPKKKTPILISRLNKAKALNSFAFVFPYIYFSLVGDFWVGKFVKVHGKRSEKTCGAAVGGGKIKA